MTALQDFAQQLLEQVPAHQDRATVVVLDGELGAGKTTLVQQLAQQLGVATPITSPTYTIMQSYELSGSPFKTLVHMDAYRLNDLSELTPLHFAELLRQPETLVVIEWGSQIAPALPKGRLTVQLVVSVAGERTGTILAA